MNKVSTSYLLWMLGFLGFAGVHRLYNRRIFTGLLWFFTAGFLGIGQFIDLFIIPGMVEEHNARLMFKRMFRNSQNGDRPRHGYASHSEPSGGDQPFPDHRAEAESGDRHNTLMIKLLHAAEKRGGKLSVTQGVIDTGYSFADVESTLREMVKTGYIAVSNDPVSGVVMFDFIELLVADISVSARAS